MKLMLPDPNEVNRSSNWDLDFRQIEPGPMATEIQFATGKFTSLLKIKMSRGVHQKGQSPAENFTFGITDTSFVSSPIDGIPGEIKIINFGTAREFDLISKAGFSGITISIPEKIAGRLTDKLALPVLDDLQPKTGFTVSRHTQKVRCLARHWGNVFSDKEDQLPEFEEEDVLACLFSIIGDDEKYDDRSPLSRRALSVRRAIAYFEDHAHDNPSIGQMCREVGFSWRTVDRSFREQFGIGPKAYLNRYRLQKVRSALVQSQIEQSIADMANEWGFWHMGQFARDYFSMFGELPSTTQIENA
jgi:AraC family transcriptional regulator, ethanolamine operon transcriptional activator